MSDPAFTANCTVIDRRFNNRRVRGVLDQWMNSLLGFAVRFRAKDIDYRYTSTSQVPPSGYITWAGISSKDIRLDDTVTEVAYMVTDDNLEVITRFRPVTDFEWYQEAARDE